MREFFIPLVHRLFCQAAEGGIYPRTVDLAKERVRIRVGDPEGVKRLIFTPPTGPAVEMVPLRVGSELRATAPPCERSGLASVLVDRAGGTQRIWYGIQGPRVDSDLAALSPPLRAEAVRRLNISEAADWPQLSEALQAQRRGSELHHWAVLLLLAVLIGEMLMGWRFV